ncbi:MAG TPA: IMP dehydrogenase [Candidatus Peribacteraceae bacterium]|nr:IMP dehydrogenase [Candidatus Peribacteraceae bacterium]
MAITANFSLEQASDLKDFDQLVLGTHNATQEIIDGHLKLTSPANAKKFHEAYLAYQAAYRKKTDFVLRHGVSTPELEKNLLETHKKYSALQDQHSADPSLAFLNKPIHRKEFNAEPYAIPGKILPPQPYLGASSAMDGIWPGYDKPEYFEQFPFLHKYEAKNPGKALHAFLREHNLFFHFPETVSRYGVLFVPPPYLEDDLNVELRSHLSTCDKLYHSAPIVSPNDTVAEARLVLSYVEDDMVAMVMDGKECKGVVGWRDLEGQPDGQLIGALTERQQDWYEAPNHELDAKEAFAYMEERDWPYMVKFTKHGPRIMTQTTASVSYFLRPNVFKNGLGSAVYFGISDTKEGDLLIDRLINEADGIPAAIVETAHGDTPFYRTILSHYRQKMQDVFMMAGTTVDTEAVLDFLLKYGADGVKLGIAEGHACRTSNTGIAPPNAHVGLECGAAAYNQGYLMLDGWGLPSEFIKGLAMSGIQMRQGGGAFMGRREAANPSIRVNGSRGKFYRGMAGKDVQEAVLGRKDPDIVKRMEARAHLHSEGAEVFVPQRSPSTVGRMLLSYMFLLKSAMSYEGVRAELADPTKIPSHMTPESELHQFHRMAKLYSVRKAA